MTRAATQGRVRAGGAVAVHDGPWGRRVLALVRDGARLRVAAARVIDAGAPLGVQQFAGEHGATIVVRVANARETMARVAMLAGTLSEEHAAGAIRLLCDAELPAVIPEHRRGGGVLGENGGGLRAGVPVLLTGWMSPTSPDDLTSLRESWTTPIAALATLVDARGGSAVYADRREGAMSIVLAGGERPVVRVLLEQRPDDASWQEAVGGALAEGASVAGASPEDDLQHGRVLWVSRVVVRALRDRVDGLRDEASWLDDYGVALGAAMLALDDRPSRAGLAGLRSSAPIIERGRLARTVDWFRSPVHAGLVLGVGAVLLGAAPVALAWARAEVLEARVRTIEESSGGREEIEKKSDLYAQLNTTRLPVTKLMMDVARAAPVGVTANTVRIAPGQGLTFRGQAESTEQVTAFQEALGKTRVFSEVTTGRVESKDGGVEFDLTARIANPHLNVQNADDFVARPLVKRLFPDGVPPPPPPDADTRNGRTTDARRPGTTGGTGGDRRPGTSAPEGPPPVVSDDEIARMDRATAIRGWTSRNLYLTRNPNLDAAEKDRLNEEIRKMRARADSLRGGG